MIVHVQVSNEVACMYERNCARILAECNAMTLIHSTVRANIICDSQKHSHVHVYAIRTAESVHLFLFAYWQPS